MYGDDFCSDGFSLGVIVVSRLMLVNLFVCGWFVGLVWLLIVCCLVWLVLCFVGYFRDCFGCLDR